MLLAQLLQDKVWSARDEASGMLMDPVPLEDLSWEHRRRIAEFIWRLRAELKASMEFQMVFGAQPEGEHAQEAFDHELTILLETTPEQWYQSLPLIKRLKELDGHYLPRRESDLDAAPLEVDRHGTDPDRRLLGMGGTEAGQRRRRPRRLP